MKKILASHLTAVSPEMGPEDIRLWAETRNADQYAVNFDLLGVTGYQPDIEQRNDDHTQSAPEASVPLRFASEELRPLSSQLIIDARWFSSGLVPLTPSSIREMNRGMGTLRNLAKTLIGSGELAAHDAEYDIEKVRTLILDGLPEIRNIVERNEEPGDPAYDIDTHAVSKIEPIYRRWEERDPSAPMPEFDFSLLGNAYKQLLMIRRSTPYNYFPKEHFMMLSDTGHLGWARNVLNLERDRREAGATGSQAPRTTNQRAHTSARSIDRPAEPTHEPAVTGQLQQGDGSQEAFDAYAKEVYSPQLQYGFRP